MTGLEGVVNLDLSGAQEREVARSAVWEKCEKCDLGETQSGSREGTHSAVYS